MTQRKRGIRRRLAAVVLAATVWLTVGTSYTVAETPPTDPIYSPSGRTVFYEREAVQLRVPEETDCATVLFTTRDGRRREVTVPATNGRADFAVSPMALSAGLWTLETGTHTGALEIVSSVRNTPFTLMATDGVPADLDQGNPLGLNLVQLRSENGHPPAASIVDRLTRRGIRFTTFGTLTEDGQVGNAGESWVNPRVVRAARYAVKLQAQSWQATGPGFIGLHFAQSPHLATGVLLPDGSRQAYVPGRSQPEGSYVGPLVVTDQEHTYSNFVGRPVPQSLKPEANQAEWLAYHRWRTTILGEALSGANQDLKSVDRALLGFSHCRGWSHLAEGVYPPLTTAGWDIVGVAEDPGPSWLGLLAAAQATEACRAGAWDRPLVVNPMPRMSRQLEEAPAALELATYAVLAGKTEGLCWGALEGGTREAMKRIAQRILPLSGMLQETRKIPNRVAILYSRGQHLHAIAEQATARTPGRDYPGRVEAAWWTAMAAGYPATLVTEEDLMGATDKVPSSILIAGLTVAEEPLRERLEQMVLQGHSILTDDSTTLEIKGAQRLPFAFPNPHALWQPYDIADPERKGDRQIFDRVVRENADALREVLGKLIRPFARCDNVMFVLAEQAAGRGRYVWAVNAVQDVSDTSPWKPVGTRARILLPAAVPVIYDVFNHRQLEAHTFELELEAGQSALYALMPEAIHLVGIDDIKYVAPFVELKVSVNSLAQVIDAVFPIEIELTDPKGTSVLKFWRGTRKGVLSERIPLGCAPLNGPWEVRVRETITQRSTRASFDVQGTGRGFATCARLDVVHPARIRHALRHDQESVLLLKGDDTTQAAAAALTTVLVETGLKVDADTAARVCDTAGNPRLPLLGGAGPLAINRQVLLVGNRQTNPLIERLLGEYRIGPPHLLRRGPRHPGSDQLGAGQAVVFWATAAFGLDNDIVVVYADDAAGLERGAQALGDLVNGRPPPQPETLDAD